MVKYFKRLFNRNKPDPNLIYVLTGLDERKYFRFKKELGLPLDRNAMNSDLLDEMSWGASAKEQENIIDTAEKAIHAGLSNPKNSAVATACLQLIRARRGTVHRDIILNIIGVWLIAEDEDPYAIDFDIHTRKVEMFEKMSKENAHAFFLSTSLEVLKPFTSIQPNDLNELLIASIQEQRAVKKLLNSLASRITSEVLEKTAKSST